MPSTPIVQYASRTDVGMRRSANQDSLAVRLCSEYEEWHRCGHLFVVADGMGGHAVGDLASRIAVETLPHAYFKCDAPLVQNRMKQAIHTANKAINDRGRENREFEGMGTTCSALSLAEGGAFIGHVGDSRVYRVRGGQIEQLTFDHSLQWEMIRLGRATVDNVELFHPRNVITRCLGPDIHVQVDIEGPFSIEAGDYFILCSDGLTNHISDSEIGQIVASLPPAESSRLLINLANCRGGTDNSTVVIVGIDCFPATVSDSPDKLTPPQWLDTTRKMSSPSSRGSQIVLAATAILCLIGGMTVGVMNKLFPAASLIAAAILAWLLSRRMASRPRRHAVNDSASTAVPIVATPEEASSRPHVSNAAFNPKSPYRTLNAGVSDTFLSYLQEVQSDLVQAAQDGAWEIDFDDVTALNQQAVSNQQAGKLPQTIRFRAKAIDLLMREMYLRSRSN